MAAKPGRCIVVPPGGAAKFARVYGVKRLDGYKARGYVGTIVSGPFAGVDLIETRDTAGMAAFVEQERKVGKQ